MTLTCPFCKQPPLNPTEELVFRELEKNPNRSLTELQKATRLNTMTSVYYIMKRLHSKGFIEYRPGSHIVLRSSDEFQHTAAHVEPIAKRPKQPKPEEQTTDDDPHGRYSLFEL